MHHAPAVSYPVGRSFFHVALMVTLVLLVIVIDLLWWLQGGRWGALEWSACLTGLAAGSYALSSWQRLAVGTLHWTGGEWYWQERTGIQWPGRVLICLDWQNGFLLQFQPLAGGLSRWFWVERHLAPDHWQALRRAALASGSVSSLTGWVA